jgi:hypothetical protein
MVCHNDSTDRSSRQIPPLRRVFVNSQIHEENISSIPPTTTTNRRSWENLVSAAQTFPASSNNDTNNVEQASRENGSYYWRPGRGLERARNGRIMVWQSLQGERAGNSDRQPSDSNNENSIGATRNTDGVIVSNISSGRRLAQPTSNNLRPIMVPLSLSDSSEIPTFICSTNEKDNPERRADFLNDIPIEWQQRINPGNQILNGIRGGSINNNNNSSNNGGIPTTATTGDSPRARLERIQRRIQELYQFPFNIFPESDSFLDSFNGASRQNTTHDRHGATLDDDVSRQGDPRSRMTLAAWRRRVSGLESGESNLRPPSFMEEVQRLMANRRRNREEHVIDDERLRHRHRVDQSSSGRETISDDQPFC